MTNAEQDRLVPSLQYWDTSSAEFENIAFVLRSLQFGSKVKASSAPFLLIMPQLASSLNVLFDCFPALNRLVYSVRQDDYGSISAVKPFGYHIEGLVSCNHGSSFIISEGVKAIPMQGSHCGKSRPFLQNWDLHDHSEFFGPVR